MPELASLAKQVGELTTETRALTERLKRRDRVVMAVIAATALVVMTFGWVLLDNRSAIRESDRRWCPVVQSMVPRDGDPAPTTERGRFLAERFREMAREFGCDATNDAPPAPPKSPAAS
jgi:type VI protein secretion system component VasK